VDDLCIPKWVVVFTIGTSLSCIFKFRVRQGDISSADLYKIYVDPLLHRLKNSGLGVKIGDVECCATACADDITINSNNEVEAEMKLLAKFQNFHGVLQTVDYNRSFWLWLHSCL
jgi:hypothetical protein